MNNQQNFLAQIAVALNFFTAVIQIIVILTISQMYSTQSRYSERQYVMFEKVLEKQQQITTSQEQQIIKLENVTRLLTHPAQ